jgi:hypothetical protein
MGIYQVLFLTDTDIIAEGSYRAANVDDCLDRASTDFAQTMPRYDQDRLDEIVVRAAGGGEGCTSEHYWTTPRGAERRQEKIAAMPDALLIDYVNHALIERGRDLRQSPLGREYLRRGLDDADDFDDV